MASRVAAARASASVASSASCASTCGSRPRGQQGSKAQRNTFRQLQGGRADAAVTPRHTCSTPPLPPHLALHARSLLCHPRRQGRFDLGALHHSRHALLYPLLCGPQRPRHALLHQARLHGVALPRQLLLQPPGGFASELRRAVLAPHRATRASAVAPVAAAAPASPPLPATAPASPPLSAAAAPPFVTPAVTAPAAPAPGVP